MYCNVFLSFQLVLLGRYSICGLWTYIMHFRFSHKKKSNDTWRNNCIVELALCYLSLSFSSDKFTNSIFTSNKFCPIIPPHQIVYLTVTLSFQNLWLCICISCYFIFIPIKTKKHIISFSLILWYNKKKHCKIYLPKKQKILNINTFSYFLLLTLNKLYHVFIIFILIIFRFDMWKNWEILLSQKTGYWWNYFTLHMNMITWRLKHELRH